MSDTLTAFEHTMLTATDQLSATWDALYGRSAVDTATYEAEKARLARLRVDLLARLADPDCRRCGGRGQGFPPGSEVEIDCDCIAPPCLYCGCPKTSHDVAAPSTDGWARCLRCGQNHRYHPAQTEGD